MKADVERAAETLVKYALYVNLGGFVLGIFVEKILVITILITCIMLGLRFGILNKQKQIEARSK